MLCNNQKCKGYEKEEAHFDKVQREAGWCKASCVGCAQPPFSRSPKGPGPGKR